MKRILYFIILTVAFGQYTLVHNGVTREYYVSYPDNPPEPCPLIINMHGFGADASWHIGYTEMDDYAIPENIAVVYPEGMLNSWNVGGFWENNNYDDVGFISVLIDSIAAQFSIDLERIYACGFSNGGYMAYELSCELSDKIAAFGSVTGNFLLNEGQVCDQGRKIPIIDFHGTTDSFVPYDEAFEGDYSPDGSMLFDENLAYWMNFNDLTEMTIDTLPDIDLFDGTWVEKYTVYSDSTTAKFIHFKVNNGGHQWFGSTSADSYIGYLGLNNHDINTNEELINFFLDYKLSDFLNENIEIDHQSGWNLVGLPIDVEDASYTTLFPESIEGTLFSYNGGYVSESELISGNGYWLRFPNAGNSLLSGSQINEITLSLSAGWNLISGTSEVSTIIDLSSIIISGSLYGYDNGYFNADELEPGKAYWVRATADGEITITNAGYSPLTPGNIILK